MNNLLFANSDLLRGKPYRLLLKLTKPTAWYPETIKRSRLSIRNEQALIWALPKSQQASVQQVWPRQIKLASLLLDISQEIPWHKSFADPEDFESLHRWNWLVYALSQDSSQKYESFQQWGKKHIDSWVTQSLSFKERLVWETYTISERIVNWILFVYLSGLDWPERWNNEMARSVNYVINHLEYRGRYTGNHVLNNARAIFLVGCAFQREDWRNFAKAVIRDETKRLLTSDGFLNDGSSHYHFLFMRWILEILHFERFYQDEKFHKELETIAAKVVARCDFFPAHFPLFGDISPDCSPIWISSGWKNLFPESKEKISHAKKLKVESYPESGWHKMNVGQAELIWHLEKEISQKWVSHAHCDVGAFCFYLGGSPVLVDAGRLNYLDSRWGNFGLSAQAHNSILIDGKGPYPALRRKFPERYPLPEAKMTFEERGHESEAILTYKGYEEKGQSIKISRSFNLSSNSLLIKDEIAGEGKFDVKIYYHWAPDFGLQLNLGNGFKVIQGAKIIHGSVQCLHQDTSIHMREFKGGDDPLGWFISEYGKKEIASTLEISVKVELPCCIQTLLRWIE